MVEPIELPPRVINALRETRNGRDVLAELMPSSERRGILGTIWDYTKWPLLLAGGLALGSHTGASRRVPYAGQYLDTAGRWITETAVPTATNFVSQHAQTFWDYVQRGWNGIRGIAAP